MAVRNRDNRIRCRRSNQTLQKQGKMTTIYLSLTGLAKRAGITVNTARSYSRDGRLPEPDAIIGEGKTAKQGWLPETIDNWEAYRPGQGFRSDLQNK